MAPRARGIAGNFCRRDLRAARSRAHVGAQPDLAAYGF